MIVLDTSGVLAYLDARDTAHDRTRRAIEAERGQLLLSPFVLAELDYLIAKHLGARSAAELLRDVADGAYTLVPVDARAVEAAIAILERYRDLAVGLADASIVEIADRFATRRICTLDHRRFRALRAATGEAFELLP